MRPAIRPSFAAALLAATACSCAKLADQAAGPTAKAAPIASTESEPKRVVYDGPATTLGRTALLRAEAAVRGKLTRSMSVGPGAEVGRLAPEEWLRGEPREEGVQLTVLSAEAGHLPEVAHEGIFLLHLLPASGNWELVEVVPLDDEDGPDRLAAFHKYLEIESIPGPSWRMSELRKYLRVAVLSDHGWIRWNAAREYAALTRDVPGALAVEDRPPLEKARDNATERPLRALLESVLAKCPGTPAKKTASSRPADPSDGGLAGFAARYAAADATPAVRRQAVIDAAVALGARAAPLFERALGDPDPTVREAGAAAAGQLRIASLEPKIAAMLAADGSPVVRRTLVVAAGRLKSSASTPSLALLATEDGPFARDAAFALARVRDDAAMAELRRLRSQAKSKDWIELLDFLQSDAFVQQERALDDSK